MNKYTLQEEIKKADSFTMSVFYNSKKLASKNGKCFSSLLVVRHWENFYF